MQDADTLTSAPLAPPGIVDAVEEPLQPTTSLQRDAWRRFWRNRAAVLSLFLMIVCILVAIFAPLLTPYDPMSIDLRHLQVDFTPNHTHWLGTNSLGQDVLARLLYGMRPPLAIAIVGAILCTLIGTVTGLAAGFYGGWIDEILVRITELIFVVPGFLLIVLCVALFGHALDAVFGVVGRLVMIMLFIATDDWPPLMRLARAEAMRLRSEQFVEAARVAGGSGMWILRRHILPHVMGVMVIQGAFLVGGFVFATAALSIVGLGTPGLPDIGQMLVAGMDVYVLNPAELLGPAIIITVLIVAPVFIADGLRDALDVRGG
jgi:ABC-type dipeptide/oligopeptide/nickel transport system permease subunit